jgi:sulfur-oxidizing protein SoxY
MTPESTTNPGRRQSLRVLVAGAAGGVAGASLGWCPEAQATPADMQAAITAFSRSQTLQSGGVRLLVPELVENGNSVPVSVQVDSPMTERDHVRRIGLFSEKNPQPQIAVFHLGPHSGRANVTTRIRLADSQRLVAIVEMADGRFFQTGVEVIVTLAACIEN